MLIDMASLSQQRRYLPAIANGSQIHTYAFTGALAAGVLRN